MSETGIKTGVNLASLRAQQSLADVNSRLSGILERLSSGQRITRPSSDAAGTSLATTLNANAHIFKQAVRNLNDGVSALNIVDTALEELTNIVERQKELAAQAASGSYSLTQRRALNTEANALTDEFNRIVSTTKFNGIALLDLSRSSIAVQAGDRSQDLISFAIGAELSHDIGTGSFGTATQFTTGLKPREVIAGDVNGDGILDLVTADDIPGYGIAGSVSVLLGNGNGTFQTKVPYAVGNSPFDVDLADFDGNGSLDIAVVEAGTSTVSVLLNNGNGTFAAPVSAVTGSSPLKMALGDLNGDGNVDIVTVDATPDAISVLLGNGDGTFDPRTSYGVGNHPFDVDIGDVNGDGFADVVTADLYDNTISVLLGNGNGTLNARTAVTVGHSPAAVRVGDFNGDGIDDVVSADYYTTDNTLSVLIANGDGTFKARTTYATSLNPRSLTYGDVNGDGILDLVTAGANADKADVFIGKGDGTFSARTSFSTGANPLSVVLGDVNGDSVLDLITANYTFSKVAVLLAATRESTTTGRVNITTAEGARAALTTLDNTLTRVTRERGVVGAIQSRLTSALEAATSRQEQYSAAYNRIVDIDVAQESAALVAAQVVQQAVTAVLAQCNQSSELVLKLLKPS